MLSEVKYGLLTAAWLAWCAMHSILIWPAVKNHLQKQLGSACRFYRLAYNLFAVLSLAPLAYMTYRWQSEPFLQWCGWGKPLQWLLLIVAGGLFSAGARQYDLLEFAGLRHHQCPTEAIRADHLSTKGVLKIVRHPWYTAVIILLWARDLDVTGLLVSSVLTLYVIVGAYLEEYKLVRLYGDHYRRYRREVSMFMPLKWLVKYKDGG